MGNCQHRDISNVLYISNDLVEITIKKRKIIVDTSQYERIKRQKWYTQYSHMNDNYPMCSIPMDPITRKMIVSLDEFLFGCSVKLEFKDNNVQNLSNNNVIAHDVNNVDRSGLITLKLHGYPIIVNDDQFDIAMKHKPWYYNNKIDLSPWCNVTHTGAKVKTSIHEILVPRYRYVATKQV